MTNPVKPLVVGMVVGELSGDHLGAGLIQALREGYPGEVHVVGIGGPALKALGCKSLFEMERLAVMGFIEPLKRLPELIHMRRSLNRYFKNNPPSVFIGIDAPDFNLGLEESLRHANIPVVHYVSPSVWAWRKGRIHKIKRAVDHMLTLFPFEAAFYEKHAIPVTFVGHPLADKYLNEPCLPDAKRQLGFHESRPVVALLPGSRTREIEVMGKTFLETAALLEKEMPGIQFVVPLTQEAHIKRFKQLRADFAPDPHIQILLGHARDAICASDVVLVTSGTATLETMLLGKPMVVAYKMGSLTYWLAKKLVKVPYIALPNLLANKALIPEHIQEEANPPALSKAIHSFLQDPTKGECLRTEFLKIQKMLARHGDVEAASVVLNLLS